MKKIFLKDIAHELNLSKTTVSFVLNGRGDEHKISAETQKKVLDFVREKNYRPNQTARSLSLGKSNTIGLIIPDISDIFYATIAHHVEIRAKKFGYNVVFSSSNENPVMESELVSTMLNRQVDGLIIASTQKNEKEVNQLKETGFPFVLIDRHYPEIKTNYVIVDNYGGALNMTQRLIDNGRMKIGFVTISSQLDAMLQRRLGYEKALNQGGIEVNRVVIKELDPFNYKTEMSGAIEDMVDGPYRVDAMVFATHYLAAAGLRELKFLNIVVPDEVAIISFDELGAFDLIDPPISACKQPVEEIGSVAVDILVKTMKKKDRHVELQRVLQTDLLIRESCG